MRIATMMAVLLLSIPSGTADDEPGPDWLKKLVYDRAVEVEGTRLEVATEQAIDSTVEGIHADGTL